MLISQQPSGGVSGLGGVMGSAEFIAAFRDLGSGAVDTALDRGVGPATFTRATAAAAKLSTGLWKLDVASGTARSSYLGMDTTVGAYGGYLAEGARTNLCLQSRDLSNASWAKVNTTGVKDQTGIDGVANSASSLTATLGGGTCLQTITEAATDSTLSMFIKRITGTGTVTIQQGATTSEISGQINSTTYTQVSLDATVLNPAIGIALGTNGDKIAVDCVQFENGAFASTPIPTTTVAVTRNADVMTYASTGNVDSVNFSFYCEGAFQNATSLGGDQGIYALDDAATNRSDIDRFNNSANFAYRGQGLNADTGLAVGTTAFKLAARVATADLAVVLNAGTPYTSAGGAALGAHTTLRISMTTPSSANQMFGMIKNVRIWTRQFSNATLQAMTT